MFSSLFSWLKQNNIYRPILGAMVAGLFIQTVLVMRLRRDVHEVNARFADIEQRLSQDSGVNARFADIEQRLLQASHDGRLRDYPVERRPSRLAKTTINGTEESRIALLTDQVKALEDTLDVLKRGIGERPNRIDSGSVDRDDSPVSPIEKALYRDRMRYSPEDLDGIEALYVKGIDLLGTSEGRQALAEVFELYPESNRGGCAAMNLGAEYLNTGYVDEARTYFEEIIDSRSEAVFEDGERVLPKAMLNLGMALSRKGDREGAEQVWKELLQEYPEQRDGKGLLYSDIIENLSRIEKE